MWVRCGYASTKLGTMWVCEYKMGMMWVWNGYNVGTKQVWCGYKVGMMVQNGYKVGVMWVQSGHDVCMKWVQCAYEANMMLVWCLYKVGLMWVQWVWCVYEEGMMWVLNGCEVGMMWVQTGCIRAMKRPWPLQAVLTETTCNVTSVSLLVVTYCLNNIWIYQSVVWPPNWGSFPPPSLQPLHQFITNFVSYQHHLITAKVWAGNLLMCNLPGKEKVVFNQKFRRKSIKTTAPKNTKIISTPLLILSALFVEVLLLIFSNELDINIFWRLCQKHWWVRRSSAEKWLICFCGPLCSSCASWRCRTRVHSLLASLAPSLKVYHLSLLSCLFIFFFLETSTFPRFYRSCGR